MKETLYGIRLNRGQLVRGDSGFTLFFRKKDAVKFRNELVPHYANKAKIVRVVVEWEDPR